MHFTTENEPDELIFDVFAFNKQKYKQIVGRNIVLADRKLITNRIEWVDLRAVCLRRRKWLNHNFAERLSLIIYFLSGAELNSNKLKGVLEMLEAYTSFPGLL